MLAESEVVATELSEPLNVLIVEDNPGDVRLIQLQLEEQKRQRFSVQSCRTLADARQHISQEKIDVVLLDLGLPDSAGLTTIRELGSTQPDLPIVAITGVNDPGLAEMAIESGAENYLVKGRFDSDFLAQSLLNAIEKKRAVRSAAYHVSHDQLTGLPNRVRFMQRLDDGIADTLISGGSLALHVIDINDFKRINKKHGDAVGDESLVAFARSLEEAVGQNQFVARLGSDEFGVYDPDSGPDHLVQASYDLAEKCNRPIEVEGRLIDFSVSVGSVLYDGDGDTSSDILVRANLALRAAKREKVTFQLSDVRLRDQYLREKNITTELEAALAQNEISVVYQPALSTITNKITSVEALARWRHPVIGAVPPYEFIKIAENAGLIHQLGDQVLRKALTDAKSWQDGRKDLVRVEVNVSALQVQNPIFSDQVLGLLEELAFDANGLTLELSETAVFTPETLPLVVKGLSRLRAAGVKISLDDFGTGSASLSYLQTLPHDAIKIDMQFVQQIEISPMAQKMARGIIALGHSFEKEIVGEGVESEQQLAFLEDLKCDFVQGFFLYKPMPAKELLKLLD